jgi:hypothetical protein
METAADLATVHVTELCSATTLDKSPRDTPKTLVCIYFQSSPNQCPLMAQS